MKNLMAGNWKMNLSRKEAVELARTLKNTLRSPKDDVLVCPPFIHIPVVSEILEGTPIKIGAQNMFYEEKGAFTGEISPVMLKDYGVSYVIIGHSERRHIFNEPDDLLNKKVKSALDNDLIPILCVGETESQRENYEHFKVLETQIKEGLKGIHIDDPLNLVIAYEPVWAIGTGKNAQPEDINEMHKHIRTVIGEIYNTDFANSMRILYGGSVKPTNVDGLMIVSQINGVLVGGASLDADKFLRIIKYKGSGC